MKKLMALLLLFTQLAFAAGETRFPNGTISYGSSAIGTQSPADSKAALDVVSTTKGFLPPRMTTTQRDAISSPPTGLTIFNTTTNLLNAYNGVTWTVVGSGGGGGSGGINYCSDCDAETGIGSFVAYIDNAAADLAVQDITYTAVTPGAGGNAITVEYDVCGGICSLSVSVTGSAITVQLTSSAFDTATHVLAAIVASTPASALVTGAITGTASNVQNPAGATNLSGGVSVGPQPTEGGTGVGSVSSTIVAVGSPTITPLRGLASYLFTKGAANRQGEGFKRDFTIDSTDALNPQKQTVSFDYKASAAFHYASNQTTDISDITVYVYDKDVDQLIQPDIFVLDGSGHFQTSFQPNFGDTHYTLLFHISTTNSSAWTFISDTISVGPNSKSVGPVVTDWNSVPWTPTGTWTTNATYTGAWRRVGDTLDAVVNIALSGTTDNVGLAINLPTGLVVDTTKGTFVANITEVGTGTANRSGVTSFAYSVLYDSTTQVGAVANSTQSGSNPVSIQQATGVSGTAPVTWNSGDNLTFHFRLPIVGWSSGVTLSSVAGPPLVAASMYLTSNYTTLTNTSIIYDTVQFDTVGMCSISTGLCKVPVAGKYSIGAIAIENTSSANIYAQVNGSGGTYLTTLANSSFVSGGPITLNLKAGDSVGIYSDANVQYLGITNGLVANSFSIYKLSSAETIANDAEISMSVYRNGSFNVGSGTNTTILFDTVEFDSTGGYDASTGMYTVSVPGRYAVDSGVALDPGGQWSSGNVYQLHFNQNSSNVKDFGTWQAMVNSTTASEQWLGKTVIVDAKAGDTFDVSIFQNQANTGAVNNTPQRCYFQVHRIK